MTAIVGILCRDGVVVGSDSASMEVATAGPTRVATIEVPCKKIDIVGGRAIVAGAGETGLHQRFCQVVSRAVQGGQPTTNITAVDLMTNLAQMGLLDFGRTFQQKGNIQPDPIETNHLSTLLNSGSNEPSANSTRLQSLPRQNAKSAPCKPITDPFLGFLQQIFWPSSNEQAPSTKEGIVFATWALLHAIQLNTGGINGPVQLAVLSPTSAGVGPVARLLEDEEIAEHTESVRAAELHLGRFALELRGEVEPAKEIELPSPDKPERFPQ